MPSKFRSRPPKEVVCPHCLESFPLWDMEFGELGVQPIPARRSLVDVFMRRPPRWAVKDGVKLRLKYCPNHDCVEPRLPYTAGEQSDLIVGIVGAKYSGKSHFVALLVHRLQRNVSTTFDSALIPLDNRTVTRYDREFKSTLIDGKQELDQTDPHAPPLLYDMSFAQSNDPKKSLHSVTLALCDTAGENVNTQEGVAEMGRYLQYAAGLVILIDPLQAAPVRENLPKDAAKLPDLDQMAEPSAILARIIQEWRIKKSIPAGTRIDTPVAVAFTKADVLQSAGLIVKDCLWSQDRFHEGHYDLQLHSDASEMFGSKLKEWSPAAWTAVTTHFERFAFFGLSATGCSSDADGNYSRVSPWRVEDPMLWLLYELGVIAGR